MSVPTSLTFGSATVIAVGIGQCLVTRDATVPSSTNPLDREPVILVAYGLGSCVGVAAWDPTNQIAGLLHVLLPEPSDPHPANPARFAATGIPHLLHEMEIAGANIGHLQISAVGGARMLGSLSGANSPIGNIGDRNSQMICAQIERHGLRLIAHDFGGSQGRTLGLQVATGACWMRVAGAAARPLW